MIFTNWGENVSKSEFEKGTLFVGASTALKLRFPVQKMLIQGSSVGRTLTASAKIPLVQILARALFTKFGKITTRKIEFMKWY